MKYIIPIILPLFLISCSPKKQVIEVPTYYFIKIQRPEPVTLLELNPKKHIGASENVDKLVENTIRLVDYNKQLLSVIEKYEMQTEKK